MSRSSGADVRRESKVEERLPGIVAGMHDVGDDGAHIVDVMQMQIECPQPAPMYGPLAGL